MSNVRVFRAHLSEMFEVKAAIGRVLLSGRARARHSCKPQLSVALTRPPRFLDIDVDFPFYLTGSFQHQTHLRSRSEHDTFWMVVLRSISCVMRPQSFSMPSEPASRRAGAYRPAHQRACSFSAKRQHDHFDKEERGRLHIYSTRICLACSRLGRVRMFT